MNRITRDPFIIQINKTAGIAEEAQLAGKHRYAGNDLRAKTLIYMFFELREFIYAILRIMIMENINSTVTRL